MNQSVTIFGNRLEKLRKTEGTSGAVLGKKLGLSHNIIYQYEHGTTEPKLFHAIAIAQYFGVTLDYLCGLSDIPKPDDNETVIAEYKDRLEADADVLRQIAELCTEQIAMKEGN